MPLLLTSRGLEASSLRAGDVLRQSAPGPYTSLVVHRSGAIPFWPLHIQRLKQSLAARLENPQAREWHVEPWHVDKKCLNFDDLDLALKVHQAAQKIWDLEGKDKDVSIVLLLGRHELIEGYV